MSTSSRTTTPTRGTTRVALLAAAVLALVAGCGSNDPETVGAPEPAAASSAFPVTVTSATGPLTLEARPGRIVSLSPTATETLFAVGAGAQVVAVDDQSDFPAEAPVTDLSGFTPNVEAVAGYRPDLVVVSDDLGGIVDALTALDVTVLVQPAVSTLDEAWAQIEALGDATGNGARAEELVGELEQRVEAAVASVPASAKGLRVFHELDDTLFTVTSRTFVGSVEKALGLVNVADDVAPGNDYPQLSAEALVKAAPQVVVLADTACCAQTAQTFGARPGFSALPAVTEGRVVEVDDDLASRWGPRIAEFAEVLAAALGGTPTR
ncbi:MAG: Fe3+ transporter substrate-binding protein [Frankiales bacterium]|nr:Fe3+ transporter substrate-binding protein [Frankiales bacterium]